MAMDKKDIRKVSAWLLFLQEFKFKVEHRPGSKMQHVDALSRMYVIQNSSILHQLKIAQQNDSLISSIIEILKEKPFKDYVMHNDLLCNCENATNQIVVPELMELSITNKAHKDGHFKRQKLEAIIAKEFYIQNLPSKIETVTRNCIECILCEKKDFYLQSKRNQYRLILFIWITWD